jgi:hypothetical protein
VVAVEPHTDTHLLPQDITCVELTEAEVRAVDVLVIATDQTSSTTDWSSKPVPTSSTRATAAVEIASKRCDLRDVEAAAAGVSEGGLFETLRRPVVRGAADDALWWSWLLTTPLALSAETRAPAPRRGPLPVPCVPRTTRWSAVAPPPPECVAASLAPFRPT